ncbi:major facilitator superfamily domain-containing protein [Fennellomyces sp. T-0311]|nr:major facilitator superfamily domain-containing protein [Fennellomyces sp. T-0311]
MSAMIAEKSSTIVINPKKEIYYDVDIREDHEIGSPCTDADKESTEVCYSDGGYGWFVCGGAFVGMFTVYGQLVLRLNENLLLTGIMINYYIENVFSGAKEAATSLSLVAVMISFVGGVFTPISHMVDSMLGARRTLLISTFLISGGFGAAGSATEVWHLYLSLGVCFGIGFAMMIMVTSKTVPEWFYQRRSTAMGIVASSGGLGGLVLPFVITPLNSTLGVSWTFRILAAIFFMANLITTVLVKERNPPKERTIKKPSQIIKLNLLKDINFLIWCLAAFFCVAYMNLIFYFLPSYATHIGLSTIQGSALVSTTAATTFLGRLTVGALADRAGNLNMCIVFNLITSAASYFIWTTVAYNFVGLLIYAIIHGFFGGCYLALLAPIVRTVLGPEKFPSGFALVSFFVAPAYAGPTIASALENHSTLEPFLVYKLFNGTMAFLAAVVVLTLKLRMQRNLWAKI